MEQERIKLKHREIAACRDSLLEQQDYRCRLCDDYIEDDAVLDHDHRTGVVRGVLHRGCNSMLGRIERNMAISKLSMIRFIKFTEQITDYMQNTDSNYIHPTFKTKEERTMAYKKKKGGGKKKRGY